MLDGWNRRGGEGQSHRAFRSLRFVSGIRQSLPSLAHLFYAIFLAHATRLSSGCSLTGDSSPRGPGWARTAASCPCIRCRQDASSLQPWPCQHPAWRPSSPFNSTAGTLRGSDRWNRAVYRGRSRGGLWERSRASGAICVPKPPTACALGVRRPLFSSFPLFFSSSPPLFQSAGGPGAFEYHGLGARMDLFVCDARPPSGWLSVAMEQEPEEMAWQPRVPLLLLCI